MPFGITEFPPNQNKPHPRCVGWSGRHGDYTRGWLAKRTLEAWTLGRLEALEASESVIVCQPQIFLQTSLFFLTQTTYIHTQNLARRLVFYNNHRAECVDIINYS